MKNKMWLFYSLSFIVLFQLNGLYQKQKLLNQNIITVYNSKSLIIHLMYRMTEPDEATKIIFKPEGTGAGSPQENNTFRG